MTFKILFVLLAKSWNYSGTQQRQWSIDEQVCEILDFRKSELLVVTDFFKVPMFDLLTDRILHTHKKKIGSKLVTRLLQDCFIWYILFLCFSISYL